VPSAQPHSPRLADTRPSVHARLAFHERLSTRVMILQAAVVAGVLLFTSWRFHAQKIEDARAALGQAGETLLPFMVPSIEPAFVTAVDDETGVVDESQVQTHIVSAAFAAAEKNHDLVYADLVLTTGTRISTFIAPGLTLDEVDRLFSRPPTTGATELVAGELIGHRQAMLTSNSKKVVATVRIAHSLARARQAARTDLATTAFIGLLIFGVAVILTRTLGNAVIYSPLKHLLAGVERIANGHLVTQIDRGTSGELGLLGKAFQEMTNALRDIVKRIQETATTLASGVAAIGQRSTESLAGSRQQSAALDKISAAITAVDKTSRDVDHHLESLMAAANQVSSDTAALSRGMSALEPQVGEFGSFVHQTDDAMQRMAGAATTIVASVAAMTEATEGVASTVVEFGQSVALIGDSTERAAALSKDVERRAAEGKEAVEHSVGGMTQIVNAFAAISTAVDGLGKSVDAIGRALEVITEVTQRTQLLSLNASILAAQAGEQGRAFAIVAGEIKALSARTSTSTDDIADTLAKLERARGQTTNAMALGLTSVQEGQRLAQNAGESISAILSLSARSHTQIAEIARASQEQIQGSRQVTSAITRIAEMGRTMEGASEDQKRSADSITSLTGQMVTTLTAVQSVIKKEVAASARTAEQISRVLEMAASIREQSGAQRAVAVDAVESLAGMRTFATQVVTVAEAVTAEAQSLAEQAEALRHSAGNFDVADTGAGTPSTR
jgi:methyl-accepting chemotaxis protein